MDKNPPPATEVVTCGGCGLPILVAITEDHPDPSDGVWFHGDACRIDYEYSHDGPTWEEQADD